ncbi:glycoside hydrolase family 32 protein [Kineococcus gynurae]|uniref:beta-fructofuranosidase n=1 Tax=Kineococcus gynurae TaxID=452979 RepID=A0ABV5LWT2_9ACTN
MTHPDPSFPALHGRPDHGWVNDPNGLAHVDGVWHVFFQHNPAAPVHADIRWGHSSSPDLLTWTTEPDALLPRPGTPDSHGCWTGCVVDDHGVPTAVYSGVSGTPGAAEVVLARSDRTLRTWVQEPTPVMGMPADPALTDVRDPFVFELDGHRYAIQGAGSKLGGARILLYGCDRLDEWEFLGDLLTDADETARRVAPAEIWECPNLVRFGEDWVLVVSLWRWTGQTHDLAGVRYLVGSLEPEGRGLRFRPRAGGEVDSGPMFYAPQLLRAEDRTLLWGWAKEEQRDPADVLAHGWSGALTFARELSLDGDVLVSSPARELTGLRRETVPSDAIARARSFEVVAEGEVSLLLDGVEVCSVPATPGSPARVLVDGSLVEVFAGPVPATLRAYPTPTSTWTLKASGPTTVHRLATP